MKTIAVRSMMLLGALTIASAAAGQLLPGSLPLGGVLGRATALTDDLTTTAVRSARALDQARLDRIAALVRDHPRAIALDPQGFPARAGEVVVEDPDDALLAAATAKGLRLLDRDEVLGIGYARFALPRDVSLQAAVRLLRELGARGVAADQLYEPSGKGPSVGAVLPRPGTGVRIGMIDGGVAGPVGAQRGFAEGAPRASGHGTAVASLMTGGPGVRGAVPGARLLAADVYGDDPAGGSALMIAKALGWLVGEQVSVVTISLTGPPNPLLARVIAAAQARGTILVAAVGNDGPASPLVYPASYPGVIAVTAVDGRKRVLIEAGRAAHLDFAAPGADMVAAGQYKAAVAVRGTSFATPLVAATIARVYPSPDPAKRAAGLALVDAGAERLDKRYGRGLVCGDCATRR